MRGWETDSCSECNSWSYSCSLGKSICPCRCNIVHLSVRHTHRMYDIIKVEKYQFWACRDVPISHIQNVPFSPWNLLLCMCSSLPVFLFLSLGVQHFLTLGVFICLCWFLYLLFLQILTWYEKYQKMFWIWCWPFWESIKWLKNRALISPLWFAHPLSFTKTTPNLAKIDSFVLLLHIHT